MAGFGAQSFGDSPFGVGAVDAPVNAPPAAPAAPFIRLVFRPPTVTKTVGEGGLWGRVRYEVGMTLLRNGEFYTSLEDPTAEQIGAADAVYLGGHAYRIRDAAEIARLRNAGYGANLTQEKRRRYGTGAYGENVFGPNFL